jgi:hypothetical protein
MFAKNNSESNHNHSMLIFTPTTPSLTSPASSIPSTSSSSFIALATIVKIEKVVVQGGIVSFHQHQRCRHYSRRQASIINKLRMNNSMRFNVKNKVQH